MLCYNFINPYKNNKELYTNAGAEQVNRAYKFRIYPNKEQRILFAKTFGCVRFVYNLMLSDKIRHYRQTGESLSVTPAQYKGRCEWLKEVDSLALANAWLNLQTAYKNFFGKKHAGFPKFKSKKNSRKRYTTNNQRGSIRMEEGRIKLPKVGYVTSEGERANYPGYLRKHEKKLARLCRWHSRRKSGSKNRERMRLRVCLEYEKITNQRQDYLHKKSYHLAEEYDAVCIETLNMRSLSRLLHFGKSVADNSFGKFRGMLSYKLCFRGKRLIQVDK